MKKILFLFALFSAQNSINASQGLSGLGAFSGVKVVACKESFEIGVRNGVKIYHPWPYNTGCFYIENDDYLCLYYKHITEDVDLSYAKVKSKKIRDPKFTIYFAREASSYKLKDIFNKLISIYAEKEKAD